MVRISVNNKVGTNSQTSFYHDEPFFGLDIGHSSMKVMQLDKNHGHSPRVLGYGVSNYYHNEAINNGVIVDFAALGKAMRELFKERLVGTINTRRVACTIPTAHTFSRPMILPPMDKKKIQEAVKLEAEQYIPVPIDNLYLDYDISRQDKDGIDLLMVATPKNVVDSCVNFLESVGLEPVTMEPTMNASARLFSIADVRREEASILIDFGSVAIDVAIFDQAMFVNSTIQGGSDTLTNMIAQQLGISPAEAYVLKSQHGIAADSSMPSVGLAARPILESLLKELHRIIRYYDERSATRHRKISQIITTGGGATTHGLDKYLTAELKLPTRRLDPWRHINFGDLQPPSDLARSMYITVAGVAILRPEEIF
ncbi:MAG: Cell division protein FtsA [Candidatus Saccharibacteria bacterium GW2011_GWA2_46_10]|nr:MAG: Cell division protein FtsA [Candidatus Saccharibacteria bacterium GW2011_GWA2_46_10]